MAEIHPHVWYEAIEVAALLKVSRRTLREAGIPNSRISPRKPLYLGRDVLAWLEDRKQGKPRLRRVG